MPRTRTARRPETCSTRTEMLFDDGWRFLLGDPPGAQAPAFNDSSWRSLDLPHDWSIEDLPPTTRSLTDPVDAVAGTWLFHRGDNPAWKDEGLDESGWETVRLPDTWERHSGYTADNVYGWYRRRVVVDGKYRGVELTLGLGMIDDVDETFFNGVRIGGTGSFPADYHSAYDIPRLYPVPQDIIRYGQENLVAVRVFDGPGNGGIYRKTPLAERSGPFDSSAPSGAATGHTLGGTGWYRKTFRLQRSMRGKRVHLQFDGVYMNADVWLNDTHLGSHSYGYTSFWYDVTPCLRADGPNVLAVQVKNQGVNARWYSGSGIYRHVWLTSIDPVHVAHWGTYVTTPRVTRTAAAVRTRTGVQNESGRTARVTVTSEIIDPSGRAVASRATTRTLARDHHAEFDQQCAVARPLLWDTDSPALYQLRTTVRDGRRIADQTLTPFGIRSIAFDTKHGFRLNGRTVKLKGGCMHHDNGCLGACAFDRAEVRRVETMKAAGFNAIRCAHNPPSPAFLDACDRLGMLVMDEAFDVWNLPKKSDDYSRFFPLAWPGDLDSMLLRDRNHPSVIIWSVGNEIPDHRQRLGVDVTRMLAAHVREVDPSRPVTSALCFGDMWNALDPVFAELDVGGYNYQLDKYEADYKRVPSRVMVASETFPAQAWDYWQAVRRLPYLIGDFVWTGHDYLGEAGIGWGAAWSSDTWPWTVAFCGDIDLCGFKRPQSYFRDTMWNPAEQVHIFVRSPEYTFPGEPSVGRWEWEDVHARWNWEGHEGRPLEVHVYSNCERVRLLLDGQDLGVQPVRKGIAVFRVPYRPGMLRATGLLGRREVATAELRTAGRPVALRLTPDRTALRANGRDLCFVKVELVDPAGVLVPHADGLVRFALEGPGVLAGVGSANPMSTESFQRPARRTWQGRCLAVVKTTQVRGTVTLTASADGLQGAKARLSTA